MCPWLLALLPLIYLCGPLDVMLKVTTAIQPSGDQPQAINAIVSNFAKGDTTVVLAGVTGSGKSATTAWVIEKLNIPTLIITPNKVLAAQLVAELKELMPTAFVGLFMSHFSYYRPEAYVPGSDTFIEKDSMVNEEIEKLRHQATVGALTRKDVVIVASVSAIYGLGRPAEYASRGVNLQPWSIRRDDLIALLVSMGYSRNDAVMTSSTFKVNGDVLEIWPTSQECALHVEFEYDDLVSVHSFDPLTRATVESSSWIFPTSHHVVPEETLEECIVSIEEELEKHSQHLLSENKILENQRLVQRTTADIENLRAYGFTKGIENYSRHFDQRKPGERPACLLDYFPKDFLLVIDESHVTVPQIAAMYQGDHSRKKTLVNYGFRLPSALDNRPLSSKEFFSIVPKALLLSATPGAWEKEVAQSPFVKQIIRPTGLVDPVVTISPSANRLTDIVTRIREHSKLGGKTLITTLTKKQAEHLTQHLIGINVKAKYIHSDIDTMERLETIHSLRKGALDVIVGVNLLREGLDIPEVSLVCVLDADSKGFLRSETSLIQQIGRAARNPVGEVVFYADSVSPAMNSAIEQTQARRKAQTEHNSLNGITPTKIVKALRDLPGRVHLATSPAGVSAEVLRDFYEKSAADLTKSMAVAVKKMDFELAALLRDELVLVKSILIELKHI